MHLASSLSLYLSLFFYLYPFYLSHLFSLSSAYNIKIDNYLFSFLYIHHDLFLIQTKKLHLFNVSPPSSHSYQTKETIESAEIFMNLQREENEIAFQLHCI